MARRYQIADLELGGTVIQIDITANDDGSLKIFDWSCGEAVDKFYGEGRDVEHWLDITPEATRQLSVTLFHDWIDDPAEQVARLLSMRFNGDTKALSKIRPLLDEFGVPYERELWT